MVVDFISISLVCTYLSINFVRNVVVNVGINCSKKNDNKFPDHM